MTSKFLGKETGREIIKGGLKAYVSQVPFLKPIGEFLFFLEH